MKSGIRLLASTVVLAAAISASAIGFHPAAGASQQATNNGIVKVRSAYPLADTVARVKADVADKGIMLFNVIDQSGLAAKAEIMLRPSTLLIFGNPALGSQFMTSNPESGIDWPVRLLVYEDANGAVWAEYNDFNWIAHRHNIPDREDQFAMATMVVQSILSTVKAD